MPLIKGVGSAVGATLDWVVLLFGLIRGIIDEASKPPRIENGPRRDNQRKIRDRNNQRPSK